ncbi:MAG: alanine racemase [Caldithrix sp.]|nr:MAG: alanine racemase [Caldithrix sp.]
MQKSSRPAWVEIDLEQLRRNFEIINRDKAANLGVISVVKDQAYGHGAVQVANMALEFGSKYLAVATLDEAIELRENEIDAPILIFGERTEEELKLCIECNFTICVNDPAQVQKLAALSPPGKKIPVHVEVDTGLSRYGVRWTAALKVIETIANIERLKLEGVMSHFAMSDELDKTFALLQLERFEKVLRQIEQLGVKVKYRHICNTGGFLDLPQAHFDLVRIGILPLGVYPSQVCRRMDGLKPVMSVKARIAAIRKLERGDYVGYGLRYQATSERKVAVIPVGYGDGYPRIRNQGEVLIHGKRAPIIGGNAMDAMMVDVTEIPETQVWDEIVLMGKQNGEEIDVHEIAKLKGTVSYDILSGWRARLPRAYS